MASFNSLAPGKFEWNFRHVIFKQILVIDGWGICHEIALMWMPLDFTDDQSTLVQAMAWCRQATSHYLSQCWPRSLSPSGVTRPQWVNQQFRHLSHSLISSTSNKTSKLHITGPLGWKFTGDWWIPLTQDPKCRKLFHIILSSWIKSYNMVLFLQKIIIKHTL